MANVKLTWNDNSTNETGFKLYRNDGVVAVEAFVADSTTLLDSPSGSSTETLLAGTDYTSSSSPAAHEFIDLGLAVGDYTYRVAAYNDAGSSFATGVVNVNVAA